MGRGGRGGARRRPRGHGRVAAGDPAGRRAHYTHFTAARDHAQLALAPFGPFTCAVDLYGDGSFYLVDAPGHLPGHLIAAARVAPGAFVFLGGDACHNRACYASGEGEPPPRGAQAIAWSEYNHNWAGLVVLLGVQLLYFYFPGQGVVSPPPDLAANPPCPVAAAPAITRRPTRPDKRSREWETLSCVVSHSQTRLSTPNTATPRHRDVGAGTVRGLR